VAERTDEAPRNGVTPNGNGRGAVHEPAVDGGQSPSDAQPANEDEASLGRSAGGSLASNLLAAAGDLRRLAQVRADRTRHRVRRVITRAPATVLAAIVVGVGAVYAVLLFIGGLAEVLDASFNRHPGLGDLAAGGLLLAAGAVGLRLRREFADRAELQRLRSNYASHRTRSEPSRPDAKPRAPRSQGRVVPR
jgi:hypothetical protein